MRRQYDWVEYTGEWGAEEEQGWQKWWVEGGGDVGGRIACKSTISPHPATYGGEREGGKGAKSLKNWRVKKFQPNIIFQLKHHSTQSFSHTFYNNWHKIPWDIMNLNIINFVDNFAKSV